MKIQAQVTPALLGMAAGAIALAISGFASGGWVTGARAEAAAKNRAESAVIVALTPLCLAKFHANPDLPMQLKILKTMSSWERGPYVEQGGWANMPGSNTANPGLARACAGQLDQDLVVE